MATTTTRNTKRKLKAMTMPMMRTKTITLFVCVLADNKSYSCFTREFMIKD